MQTLLPFSPNAIVFYKLGHDYPKADEARRNVEAVVAEVRERIVDRLWGDSAESFVMQSTARGYAGAVEVKRYLPTSSLWATAATGNLVGWS
jgi:hypothetical protein